MKSGSSAPIGSGGHSAGTLALSSCHHTSRLASQATLPPVCLTTSTFLTSGAFLIASSVLTLSGTGLPPRRPPSAVMTIGPSQSTIRFATHSPQHPPNTTQPTTPTPSPPPTTSSA